MSAYQGSMQENTLVLLRKNRLQLAKSFPPKIGCLVSTCSSLAIETTSQNLSPIAVPAIRLSIQPPRRNLGSFNSHSLAPHQLTQKAGFNGHLIKCEVLVRGAKISKSHTNCVKPGHQWKARRELVEMVEMEMVETHTRWHSSSLPKSSHNPKTQHLIWASQIRSENHSIASHRIISNQNLVTSKFFNPLRRARSRPKPLT